MTPEERERLIEIIRSGQNLDPEWGRVLFPPDKREYELVYRGKERREKILADTMAVPLQPVRTFGRNGKGWHNMLVFGDNLQVTKTLSAMKRRGELTNKDGSLGARLIYIDPPFATKQDFAGSQDQKAYQDKIAGSAFLEFLRKRLIILHDLLSENGSLYIHLDMKKGHYLKILLDEVFGEQNFVNEIVWYYRNKLGTGGNVHDRRHDVLYLYRRGASHIFNEQIQPVLLEKMQPVTQKIQGKRVWLRDDKGKRIYQPSKATRPIGDVWELPIINPVATERLDYPTQKPEPLLERIIRTSSNSGDLVIDAFAGSGTTCAVAEKLGRRWIGIDCGKLAIYTIQKRMLNLKSDIGNKGKPIQAKPFKLSNAGLYDFSRLRDLPWEDWRFFCLQLFQCKDEPHRVGGIALDGFLKGSDVLIFDHFESPGARVTYETIDDIHTAVKRKVGSRFFIIAPALSFDFQEDYVDRGGTRYYALRVPYSIINELHRREFTVMRQPVDEAHINDTVDSVGFDFIRTPEAKVSYRVLKPTGETFGLLRISVTTFKSEVTARQTAPTGNLDSLAMFMVDVDYDGEEFDLDYYYFAEQLKERKYCVDIPVQQIGNRLMLVLVDMFGNEFREVLTSKELEIRKHKKPIGKRKQTAKASRSKRRTPTGTRRSRDKKNAKKR